MSCNGTTEWATAVAGSTGVFLNGTADAAVETLNIADHVSASLLVKLFWSK